MIKDSNAVNRFKFMKAIIFEMFCKYNKEEEKDLFDFSKFINKIEKLMKREYLFNEPYEMTFFELLTKK